MPNIPNILWGIYLERKSRKHLFPLTLLSSCIGKPGAAALSSINEVWGSFRAGCVLIRSKLFGKAPCSQHWVQRFAFSHLTSAWEWKAQFAGIHRISLCLHCPVFQRCSLLPMDYIRGAWGHCPADIPTSFKSCLCKNSGAHPLSGEGEGWGPWYSLCSHCLPVNPVLHVHCPVMWSQSAPFWHWHTLAQFLP